MEVGHGEEGFLSRKPMLSDKYGVKIGCGVILEYSVAGNIVIEGKELGVIRFVSENYQLLIACLHPKEG